jgi:hypothetical protein
MSLNWSKSFERNTAHHQELKTVKPEAAITVLNSRWRAVYRSKHVEQLRNIGIINSTTRLHLVGCFYTISLIISSEDFQDIYVHLVYNSALFLAHCCCSFLLHVVHNSICSWDPSEISSHSSVTSTRHLSCVLFQFNPVKCQNRIPY